MPLLMPNRVQAAIEDKPAVKRPPEQIAEKILADAEMLLSMGQDLGDDLEGRLEAVAQDTSLPKALRARALITLCRAR
jgi:hypothetical protein